MLKFLFYGVINEITIVIQAVNLQHTLVHLIPLITDTPDVTVKFYNLRKVSPVRLVINKSLKVCMHLCVGVWNCTL